MVRMLKIEFGLLKKNQRQRLSSLLSLSYYFITLLLTFFASGIFVTYFLEMDGSKRTCMVSWEFILILIYFWFVCGSSQIPLPFWYYSGFPLKDPYWQRIVNAYLWVFLQLLEIPIIFLSFIIIFVLTEKLWFKLFFI